MKTRVAEHLTKVDDLLTSSFNVNVQKNNSPSFNELCIENNQVHYYSITNQIICTKKSMGQALVNVLQETK